jgi:hypothetical protein
MKKQAKKEKILEKGGEMSGVKFRRCSVVIV